MKSETFLFNPLRFLLLVYAIVYTNQLTGQDFNKIQLVRKKNGKSLTISAPAVSRIKTSDSSSISVLYRSRQGQLIIGQISHEDQKRIKSRLGSEFRTLNLDTLNFETMNYLSVSTKQLQERKYRMLRTASLFGVAAYLAYPFVMPKGTSNAVYVAGAMPLFLFVGGYFHFGTKKFRPTQWRVGQE